MEDVLFLIHLAHLKNELNRRRRRFYYHMTRKYMSHGERARCLNGYIKAQTDMKAMTKQMRHIRIATGASVQWGDSGNITRICWGNKITEEHQYFNGGTFTTTKHAHEVHAGQFETYSQHYLADSIILGKE